MPVIKVINGMGSETPIRAANYETLPAFLPDGTVCSDGEYYGCHGYFHQSFGITTVDKEHEDLPFPFDICYLCGVDESPADKYIKALEGLKKVDMTGWAITYVNVHNNAINLAIKTIREI